MLVVTRFRRRGRRLTYRLPCPGCGDALVAYRAVTEEELYLQCQDCELAFSEPAAVRQPVGKVFQNRELAGQARLATLDEVATAGWDPDDFR